MHVPGIIKNNLFNDSNTKGPRTFLSTEILQLAKS